MSSSTKKTKKKKDIKKEVKREVPVQVVTRNLADNTYSGIIREGSLGTQFLECGNAKYHWKTGIKYEGPFVASRIEGRGRLLWPDGSSYEGELHNGKRHGEGSFVADDGITRYEGQWYMGKRHGRGKLTYLADGTSEYDGNWQNGKKHGEGKQVWQSGNTYEGQWESGKMKGHGSMTWRTAAGLERFLGQWENSYPHGEGTHTWHAPEAKEGAPHSPPSQLVQQQMNNCYRGQWVKGKREGVGTFFYANGAYYYGEWKDHLKHGHGRYTNEDGQTTEGTFTKDRMDSNSTSSTSPPPSQGNMGSDDNPISRTTDLSDLEVFALPRDCRGHAMSAGTGYSATSKIFREVYNMLLRFLGELRELYSRYRKLLPMPGEDPFLLSSHQFWMLARDFGLVTPGCSLSRFDRYVFNGPRHHQEAAPDDIADLKPLSPRLPTADRRASADSRSDATFGLNAVPRLLHDLGRTGSRPTSRPDSAGVSEDTFSLDSSSPSPMHAATADAVTGGRQSVPVAITADRAQLDTTGEAVHDDTAPQPSGTSQAHAGEGDTTGQGGCQLEASKYTKFWRCEGIKGLVDIHSPSRSLLFRQFLEGIVRIAAARFPNERGLEPQIQRLFKERIKPNIDSQPTSDSIFSFLTERAFHNVMSEFEPSLRQAFRGNARGDTACETGASTGHMTTGEGNQGITEEADHLQATRYASAYAGVRRHYHVNAKLDSTIRLKDLLCLLDRLGLLRPVPSNLLPQGNAREPVFPAGTTTASSASPSKEAQSIEDSACGAGTAVEREGPEQDQDAPQRSALGFGGNAGIVMMQRRSDIHDDPEMSEELGRLPQKASARRRTSDRNSETDRNSQRGEEAGLAEPMAADLVKLDFRLTPLDVIRISSEVLSPCCQEQVYWELGPEELEVGPANECVSLLEYVEAELMFSEFVRLIARTAEHTISCEPLLREHVQGAAARFDYFLRHVFFPAFKHPFAHSDSEVAATGTLSEASEGTQGASSNGVNSEPAVEASEGDPDLEGEDPAAITQATPPVLSESWHGYDDGNFADRALAPRVWPDGYEQEVLLWR